MDSINTPESTQKQPIPTHLVGILEAGTAVIEGHERAFDHIVFEVQVETKLPA